MNFIKPDKRHYQPVSMFVKKVVSRIDNTNNM